MGRAIKVKIRRISTLFLIIWIFTTIISYGQTVKLIRKLTDKALEQAKIMGQSYLKGDYRTFAKYTYPAIVNSMGGESRMATVLANSIPLLVQV